MRHAISIAAAASGTVLLALALFGDPATYMRELQLGWQSAPADDVPPVGDAPATPDQGAGARDTTIIRQMDALRTEVTKLREALTERGPGGAGDLPAEPETDAGRGVPDKTAQDSARSTLTPPPADNARPDALPRTPERLALQNTPSVAPSAPPVVMPQPSAPAAPVPQPRGEPAMVPKMVVTGPATPASPGAEPPGLAPRSPERTADSPGSSRVVALPRMPDVGSPEPGLHLVERVPTPEPVQSAPTAEQPLADRSTGSEPAKSASKTPTDVRTATRQADPDATRSTRRSQASDVTDTKANSVRKPDSQADRTNSRVAIVTPPPSPRATPKAENPPIQAAAPQLATTSTRRDAGRGTTDVNADTETVLARLRQSVQPPFVPPALPAPDPVRMTEAAPRDAAASGTPRSGEISGSVGRLRSAQSDLMSGRIEAARKLLQQAQLSLVFRPIGEEPSSDAINAGAANVGKALSALGQNDVRSSLGFIDRAVANLLRGPSGTPATPASQTEISGGYAPAYPPR